MSLRLRGLFLHGPLRDAAIRALVLPPSVPSLWHPNVPPCLRGMTLPGRIKGFELTGSASEHGPGEADESPVPLPRPGRVMKGVVVPGVAEEGISRVASLFSGEAGLSPVVAQVILPEEEKEGERCLGEMGVFVDEMLAREQPVVSPGQRVRARVDALMLHPRPEVLAEVSEAMRFAGNGDMFSRWHLHLWPHPARKAYIADLTSQLDALGLPVK